MNSRKRKASTDTPGIGIYMPAGPDCRPMTDAEYAKQALEARQHTLKQIGATINVMGPTFSVALDQLAAQIYSAMETNGFWDGTQDNFASKTALCHSELSEMLEANRKSIEADDKVPEFTGEEAEAADTMIRLLDMAGRYNWRLGEAIIAKMLCNLQRPLKHGKAY